MKLLNYFILFILFTNTTLAQSVLTNIKNSRTFESQHESLIVRSLGFACLGLEDVSDGILCNPAMTPKAKKGNLKVEGLISNGYGNLGKIKKFLSNSIDENLVNELFDSQQVLQTETSVDVMFTSPYLNARFSPVSYKFFSVAKNVANPDIELFAVEEKDLTFQSGFSLGEFDLGLEIQKRDWKFIRSRFKLYDLLSEAGKDAVKPKDQSGLFLNPALNYNLNNQFKTVFSIKLVNLGWVNKYYEEFQHPTELQYGVSVTPNIYYGQLTFLLDYKSLSNSDSDFDKLHFGTHYKFGAMNLGFGIDNNGTSFGVFYGLEQINASILFSTTELPWKSSEYLAQTVYLQIGIKL